MAVELSIVMPCLNEAETLEICIRKAQSYLLWSKVSGEIVVGDNGSTDGSQEIATKLGARVIHVPIRGYGAALYGAITAAQGRYCIMGDADDSYDFEGIDEFVEKLRAGYDVVVETAFRAASCRARCRGRTVTSGIPYCLLLEKFSFAREWEIFIAACAALRRVPFRRWIYEPRGWNSPRRW